MDDAAQEQRRRSSADWMNEGATRLILFLARRSILSPLAGLGPIVLTVFGVIFFFALLILITGGGMGIGIPGSPSPTPAPIAGGPGVPGGGSGYLTQCLFQDRGSSIKIGNPEVAKFVEDVAKKVDVPAALVMAVFRRESGDFFADSKPETFLNDYNATLGGKDPDRDQRATGAMQMMPTTSAGVFRTYRDQLRDLFGKTEISLDTTPHTYQQNDSVLRIGSIRDSIIAGTFELKRLKDRNPDFLGLLWTAEVIKDVAGRYHGGEAAPNCSIRYCDDVWESVQKCEFNPYASARQFSEAIIQECDYVKSDNVDRCLSEVPDWLNRVEEAKGEIRRSVASYTRLQCIGFAQSIIPITNAIPLNNPPNPRYLVNNPPSGYTFISKGSGGTIQKGDFPIWYSSAPGHIGYVINAAPDGSFTVVDGNWCNYDCGKVQVREDSLATKSLEGWLRRSPSL